MIHVYTRVSSDTQADATGVQSQVAAITHWLKGAGIEPDTCRWWSDLAVSGATMERPEWERMLAEVAQDPAATIIVHDLTRAGRSLVGVSKWVDAMNRQGVRLVFVKEAIDVATPTGKLLLGILASVAEFELASIRERIGRGVRSSDKRRLGGWGGQRLTLGVPGGPKLTPKQRETIREEVQRGAALAELAKNYGVHENTIRKWGRVTPGQPG